MDALSTRRRLSATEADELVELYQRAATHLSVVRSASPDPAVAGQLSRTVARARSAVTGGHEPLVREIARAVLVSFPAAVWRSRWWTAGSAGFFLLVSVALGIWVATDPAARAVVLADPGARDLVENQFADYYHQDTSASFSAGVWSNNFLIAGMTVAFGVFGLPVVYMLFQNALNVGASGGVMAAYGRLDLFFGLITPHGLLELTAVFVASGAGLRLFWSWVAPGPRSRSQSMAREGRSMVTVALGLVVVLLVSGVIEGFVTPSPLPTWARIAIGVLAWSSFAFYVTWFGRPAVARGETGDLRAELLEDRAPVLG